MAQQFKEYAALAFQSRTGGGNPAAIFVTETELDPLRAQELARQRDVPVCAFLRVDAPTPMARFFSSREELPMCGHGVLPLGALILRGAGGDAKAELITQTGLVKVARDGDLFALETSSEGTQSEVPDPTELLACFSLRVQDLHDTLPYCVASIGSPKCLIPVRVDLRDLAYDAARLERWSRMNGVNGAYVYQPAAAGPEADFDARAFNPKSGQGEDAATGVAAGALIGALSQGRVSDRWTVIRQGAAMGRPCELFARRSAEGLRVGGRVQLTDRGICIW